MLELPKHKGIRIHFGTRIGNVMKNRGFTLIELMITIAILAIIVGIALPAYNNQVEKTRRADAIAGLMSASQAFERCFTRENSYETCTLPTYNGTDTSPDGFYDITVSSSATGYTLTATRTEDSCSPFTLDHRGNKTPMGTSDRCWGSN